MKKEKKFLDKFLLIFLYSQAFLDVFTSFQIHFLTPYITIGIIARVLFIIILLVLFVKEKRKLKDYLYFLLYGIYIILFVWWTIENKSISALSYETKNLFHIIYFPITLYTLKKLKPNIISEHHLIKISFIYLLFLVIPGITGTSFEGYKEGKTGVIGWFYATNEISAIICILMPFIFHYIFKEKGNKYIKIILAFLLIYATLNIGAKMTVVTFALLLTLYGILEFIKWKKQKNYLKLGILSFLIILLVSSGLFLLPKTSIYYNMKLHLEFLEIHSISDAIKNDRFLDHFIFSERLSFLKQTHQNYKNATFVEKQIGIGYIENYQKETENRKTIEMDYFDIFYRTGLVGTILFLYPFVDLIKQKKKVKNRTYQLSILLALFIGGFAGHVLTSPAVSIYLTVILLNNKERNT